MQPLSITAVKTVGEIVAADYRTAAVFKKYGIDFCCGGKKSIEQVCISKGVDPEELKKTLNTVQNESSRQTPNYDAWSLSLLTDYIVQKHHTYTRERLPMLLEFAEKVARVHGEAFPESLEIATLVKALSDELTTHLTKEEQVLFPWIKALSEPGRTLPTVASIEHPVHRMEEEHEIAGEILHRIRTLSHDYALPEWACNTWRVLWSMLAEFEEDLHEHVHLENNILFPKAISRAKDNNQLQLS